MAPIICRGFSCASAFLNRAPAEAIPDMYQSPRWMGCLVFGWVRRTAVSAGLGKRACTRRPFSARLLQKVGDTIALFEQLLECEVHALTRESVDLQVGHALVFTVLAN